MFSLLGSLENIISAHFPVGKKIRHFNDWLVKIAIKHQNRIFFLYVLFIVITFAAKAQFFLDPDFGWRLRHGQIIAKDGFVYKDPFSYTMPSFPFVDHAWLVSFFIGSTYPVFGKLLLTAVFTFVLFFSIYVSFSTHKSDNLKLFSLAPTSKLWKWGHPLVILSMAILLPYFSIRAQVVTWLMFSVLVFVTSKKEVFEKYKYFLPLFFVLWANLHGGYALGLFVLYYTVIFGILKSFLSKKPIFDKTNTTNLLVIVFSTIAVFVNPYGAGSVKEVYSSISDPSLRFKIAEWLPSLTYFDLSVALYVPVVMTAFFLNRKKLSLKERVMFIILFLFALSSRRNFPFWVIYSLPIASDLVKYFYNDLSKKPIIRARFWVVYRYFLFLAVGISLLQTAFSVWRVFAPSNGGGYYPVKAVEILRTNLPSGEIFSNYGWGGYLIWHLPEKKVFVDGRMPSWKFNPPDEIESKNAFEDYGLIKEGELDFNEVSENYKIDTVLWPKEEETFSSHLEKLFGRFINKNKEAFSLPDYLQANGWVLVYEDKEALIFKYIPAERI